MKISDLTASPKAQANEENLASVDYGTPPNVIDDTNKEISTLLELMASDSKKEKIIRARNTNAKFFFAVYFQDEDQKNELLKKIGAEKLTTGQYIDGITFAKHLGIDIQKKEVKIPSKFKGFKTE